MSVKQMPDTTENWLRFLNERAEAIKGDPVKIMREIYQAYQTGRADEREYMMNVITEAKKQASGLFGPAISGAAKPWPRPITAQDRHD